MLNHSGSSVVPLFYLTAHLETSLQIETAAEAESMSWTTAFIFVPLLLFHTLFSATHCPLLFLSSLTHQNWDMRNSERECQHTLFDPFYHIPPLGIQSLPTCSPTTCSLGITGELVTATKVTGCVLSHWIRICIFNKLPLDLCAHSSQEAVSTLKLLLTRSCTSVPQEPPAPQLNTQGVCFINKLSGQVPLATLSDWSAFHTLLSLYFHIRLSKAVPVIAQSTIIPSSALNNPPRGSDTNADSGCYLALN